MRQPFYTLILAWPRPAKRLVVVTLDIASAFLATWLAFTLRLDTLHRPEGIQWAVYALAPLLALPIFIRFGLYRAIFRYTGLAALTTTAQAIGIYALVLMGLLHWLQLVDWGVFLPRTIGILQPLIFLLLIGSSRALARFWLTGLFTSRTQPHQGRLLIYGAGDAGVQAAAAIGSAKQPYLLLGFLDDDTAKIGRSINGVPVFSPHQVQEVVIHQGVSDLLLAMPSATRERRNEIIKGLQNVPIHIRTLPSMTDLASGRVTVQDIRELDIEDLLGRPPVPPNATLLAQNLTGKVVLVTGAGGSIGSELCRQIVQERPTQLLLLDHNEFGLYSVHEELLRMCLARQLDVVLTPILGSVGNYTRMSAVFAQYQPETVYHAAAYKHVPMVERNPAEGVLNNVFGTLNTARAAMENAVKHFVLISTDKAVRPTNIMGATKRVAELILQALAASSQIQFDDADTPTILNKTVFSMVRFGNVLGSSGSVVPLFRQQLAAGGPLTVTHPDITRYFMTIPEAAQLVLQAGAMATGGEVFVLDMGEPIKIMDLARRMVMLSGLTVREAPEAQGDIEIAVTGLRPGEKLFEELLIGDGACATSHLRILKAREKLEPWHTLTTDLGILMGIAISNDTRQIRNILQKMVIEFHPS